VINHGAFDHRKEEKTGCLVPLGPGSHLFAPDLKLLFITKINILQITLIFIPENVENLGKILNNYDDTGF
jgi:hypothetical protein